MTVDITAGRHVHANANVAVSHDALLEDSVTLLPGCSASGQTRIGRAATVGSRARVIEGITVGAGATVGTGAVVIRDVPGERGRGRHTASNIAALVRLHHLPLG